MNLSVVAGLSQQEQTELAKAESRVERWFQVSLDAGEALAVIRDKRLYRATHDRWVDYCKERWGKDGSYCDRLVKAWEVAKTLPIGSRPSNEAQARALRAVDPEEREQVVELAREQSGKEEPTAKDLMAAAAVVAGDDSATETSAGLIDTSWLIGPRWSCSALVICDPKQNLVRRLAALLEGGGSDLEAAIESGRAADLSDAIVRDVYSILVNS